MAMVVVYVDDSTARNNESAELVMISFEGYIMENFVFRNYGWYKIHYGANTGIRNYKLQVQWSSSCDEVKPQETLRLRKTQWHT